MGLWLVQECRRSLARDGRDFGYDELTALAAAAPANGPLVDASDSRFLAPADMPAEIAAACGELGQSAPDGPGALIRCCLESLALAYRRTLNDLQDLLAVRFDALHIVGGGTKNKLLNQLASDACGIAVVAGPAEATALGNVLGQLVGCGELAGWEDARTVSRNSFKPDIYEPDRSHHEAWLDREAQFIASTAR
jgi:rhamnulokinase